MSTRRGSKKPAAEDPATIADMHVRPIRFVQKASAAPKGNPTGRGSAEEYVQDYALSPEGTRLVEAHKQRMREKPAFVGKRAPSSEAEQHAEVIAAARAKEITVTPSGMVVMNVEVDPETGEPVSTVARQRAVARLRALLGTVGAKIAVLRATGCEMAPVPRELSVRAADLARILGVVGGSNEAPTEYIATARRAVESAIGIANAPGWQFVLEGIFKTRDACGAWPADAREAALYVARTLAESAPDTPACFRALAGDRLTAARELIVRMRAEERHLVVRGDKPAKVTRANHRPRSAWAWAHAFATACGATMAGRRSDATRKRDG